MKKLAILFLMVGMTLCVTAQTAFMADVPAFRKIVKVKGNSINLRQKPSIQSKIVDNLANGDYLAVVGEKGDWYHVCRSEWITPNADKGGNATVQIPIQGYVMKKYCQNCELGTFNLQYQNVFVKTSGRHQGICLWSLYNGHEEDWHGLTFAIGKMQDNIAVLPYRISVSNEISQHIGFHKDQDGNCFRMDFSKALSDGFTVNMNRLTDADIDFILSNIRFFSKESGRIAFVVKGEENGYHDIYFGDGKGLYLQAEQKQAVPNKSKTIPSNPLLFVDDTADEVIEVVKNKPVEQLPEDDDEEMTFVHAENTVVHAEKVSRDDEVFNIVEQMPSFPGGQTEMNAFINRNLYYPPLAKENGIQGRVVCSVIIERDGTISNVKVVRSIDSLIDEEAVRLIHKMPRWNPGRQNGHTVRVKYSIPINFRL